MVLELKLCKIGDSVGIILPQEALVHLQAREGDALVLTDTPEGGLKLNAASQAKVAAQLDAADSILQRYRNTLSELAK